MKKSKTWMIIYWFGAICLFYGFVVRDQAVFMLGFLISFFGAIKGLKI